MGRECNLKQQSIQGWTPNLIWSDKKVKTKNWHGSFETNSIFRTSVHGFSPDLSRAYLCTPSRFVLHTHFFESFEKKKPGWQSVGSNSTESELFSVEYTSVNIIVRFFLRLLLYTPSVSRNENDTDSLGTITNKLSSSRSFCALFSRSISKAKTLVITSLPSSSKAFRLNGPSSPGETWNRKSYKTFRAQCHLDHHHHQHHHHHQLFTKTGKTLTPQALNTCVVLVNQSRLKYIFKIQFWITNSIIRPQFRSL